VHPEVEQVVTELDAHRARFEAFCRSLSDEELGRAVPRSTWLVRDFIAHLATIDLPVMRMFSDVQEGGDGRIGTGGRDRFDVDQWNEEQIQARRRASVEELLREAAEVRSTLRGVLSRFSEENLAHRMKFQGDSKRPASEIRLGSYLRGWCKHDPMHALDMCRALPERLTPEMQAWFDDPIIAGYQAAMNRSD
jgi:hypothetical protein